MTTTNPSLDTIDLPRGVSWTDEIGWTVVEQSEEYCTDGSLDIQVSTKLAGRPLTISGGETTEWVTRQTVLDLLAFAAVPGKVMTYTHSDGREFTVMFRRGDGDPVQASPVFDDESRLVATSMYCSLTLRLMEI